MSDALLGYDRLYPQWSVLKDEVVLAQAWKKTHTFIRRQNWYADTLELDTSAVCLPSLLAEWSDSISRGRYSTSPAWLVPAPKNEMWRFSPPSQGGWGPVVRADAERPVLRPLAHVGIREQTVATAVMLCLADCVESAQGDTSLSATEAARAGVYSYGNRLFCSWNASRSLARFSYGNSNTYSRYFQDYQSFVARPVALANEAESQGHRNVHIVSLDISAFFDNINIKLLINKLEDEYQDFFSSNPELQDANLRFWKVAEEALTFSWRNEDTELAPLLRGGVLPSGLPQGLVASGFFANSYLLKFDRAIGSAIGKMPQGKSFVVHDYCRYVDDLRLVISVPTGEPLDENAIKKSVSAWVQASLKRHTSLVSDPSAYLRLNVEKTQIESLSEVGGDSRTTLRMKTLQAQLSGPFDLDSLMHAEAGLNGLLSLAELGLIDDSPTEAELSGLRLENVAKTKLEVRADTLTRFSAYRLSKSLRLRRNITDITEIGVHGSVKENLIHDFQAAARRLVASWAVNPSLVQVLRYALDLYPSAELLDSVTEALLTKVDPQSSAVDYERRVAFYVLADILKAGGTETGRRAAADHSFKVSDVDAYRANLTMVALGVLEIDGAPWYVRQQASMFLSALGHRTASATSGEELKLHRVLEAYVKAIPSNENISLSEELAVSLVGHQLIGLPEHYYKWFQNFCEGREKSKIGEAWKIIAETDPDLFSALFQLRSSTTRNLIALVPKYISRYWEIRYRPTQILETRRWIPLLYAIGRHIPHFSQENGLLKLASKLTLINFDRNFTPELFSPLNIEIYSEDWSRLNDPRFADDFELRITPGVKVRDRLYDTPSWCKGEHAWMYAIGRLLRAAATGEPDFTTRQWLFKEDAHWYLGLRSTWHKRRVGMSQAAEVLRGTSAAITPWFSDLLLNLLRWPGAAENGESSATGISNRRDLARHLKSRLTLQKSVYGKSSELPIYRYPVAWPIGSERRFKIAMVQGLMPLQADFGGSLSNFDAVGYREKHRNHTAALLHLTSKHLAVRNYVLGSTGKPHFDLVVFPELTIHVDDQDLMRSFSDSTGAMLFYGLLGAKDPATHQYVNAARWLVPQRRLGHRSWIEVDQGKHHLTPSEPGLGITSWRPYQVVIEVRPEDSPTAQPYRLTGSICFDATDLALAADLRDESHMYVVAAMNKDVKTFDGMVTALRYHMYQHVLIANVGEWGGSTAQAPYDKEHQRLISHAHGANQLAVSVFEVSMDDFGPKLNAAEPGSKEPRVVAERIGKSPPAGLSRRGTSADD